MKFSLSLITILLPSATATAGAAASSRNVRVEVTPVQKVIQLLDGMLAKGKQEMHDEQVQFAAFKEFCDNTVVDKQRAIKEANEKIDMLKADIDKYAEEAAKLGAEIAAHEEDIAAWNG